MRRPSDETHTGTVSARRPAGRELNRSDAAPSDDQVPNAATKNDAVRGAASNQNCRLSIGQDARGHDQIGGFVAAAQVVQFFARFNIPKSGVTKPTDRSDFPSPTNASDRTTVAETGRTQARDALGGVRPRVSAVRSVGRRVFRLCEQAGHDAGTDHQHG